MKNLLKLLRDNQQVPRTPVDLVKNADGSEITLYLYDVIADGWGISAMDLIAALSQVDKTTTVRMRIKSPGGDVMEAKSMVVAMREFIDGGGRIIAQVDAVAASCASWVALAANEVEISEGAFMMIHKAQGGAWGTDLEMRKMADVITMVEQSIVDLYAKTTGNSTEQLQQWMTEETWFTAQEAVANGFAKRVIPLMSDQPTNQARLAWNLSAYEKAPDALKNLAPADPPPLDVAAVMENNQRRLRLLDINA